MNSVSEAFIYKHVYSLLNARISLIIICVSSDYPAVSRIPADTTPLSDPISATRVLCGALILPTIATIVGKLMFGNVHSNFQRTLLVSLKGTLSQETIQKSF